MEERRKKKRDFVQKSDVAKGGVAVNAVGNGLEDLISAIRSGKAFGGSDSKATSNAPVGMGEALPTRKRVVRDRENNNALKTRLHA